MGQHRVAEEHVTQAGVWEGFPEGAMAELRPEEQVDWPWS